MAILPSPDANHACYAETVEGVGYLELSCQYGLQNLYTKFERTYDGLDVLEWMKENPYVPIIACAMYLVLIRLGQSYFSTRERLNWRTAMALWNLSLSVFSAIGALRTWPQLFHNLATYSISENLCTDPRQTYGAAGSGLWMQLFVLSKFPELIDTLFIVIHKKPLIFLHWYHHVTVLLYCWHSYVTKSPPGIVFGAMNYSVHAVMYGYYFLMAARMRPKWFNPIFITVAQISQMVVGVAVTILGFYYSNVTPNCHITAENNTAAFVMYGSYLFLFVQFFCKRYLLKQQQHAKKKTV